MRFWTRWSAAANMNKLRKKFDPALRGLGLALGDHSVQTQLMMAALAVMAGLILSFAVEEWLVMTGLIGLVIVTEIVNTALERLCDFIHPDHHEQIRNIKDLAAGAVLAASSAALIAGLLIVVRHLTALIG